MFRVGRIVWKGMITVFLWVVPLAASAQVAVYQLEMGEESDGINFGFFDGGYFVMDGQSEYGSFVFTRGGAGVGSDGDEYFLAMNTAQTFLTWDQAIRKVVVRATAQTETAIAYYLAFGEVTGSISATRNGEVGTYEVAPFLHGYVMASDDESDVVYPNDSVSHGFAGYSSIKFKLDRGLTEEANSLEMNLEEVLTLIGARLEERGYVLGTDGPNENALEEVQRKAGRRRQ